MVAVEDDDQLAPRLLHRVVEVARLGVAVVRPGQVMASQSFAEFAQFLPAAVIQHPDPFVRVIDDHGPDDGAGHHVHWLAVAGNEHIDGGPAVGVGGRLRRAAQHGPVHLVKPQRDGNHPVALGQKQQDSDNGGGRAVEIQRVRDAPPEMPGNDEARNENGHTPHLR